LLLPLLQVLFQVLFQALAEAEALALQQQDMAAMHQPVEQGCGHAFMAKHLRPMGEIEIRSERDAGPLIAIGKELELTFRTPKYAVFAIFSNPDKSRLFLA
jgi:hypothetical protein